MGPFNTETGTSPRQKVIAAVAIVVIIFSIIAISRYFISADSATALKFYVATDGLDSNPGTSSALPFKTIQKARNAASSAATSLGDAFPGANIYIRGGDYYLEGPIVLNADDSGRPGAEITYINYNGETPTIYGSKKLSGWTLNPATGLYEISLAGQTLAGLTIADIYLNGETQILGQEPNYKAPDFTKEDPYNAGTDNWYFASLTNSCTNSLYNFVVTDGGTINATAGAVYQNNGKNFTVSRTVSGAISARMTYDGAPEIAGTLTKMSGDGDSTIAFKSSRQINPTLIYNYKTQTDLSAEDEASIQAGLAQPANNRPAVNIYPRYEWTNVFAEIEGINSTTKTITTATTMGNGSAYVCPKNRYYVNNFLAAVNDSKEWYQDKLNNKLYYKAPRALNDTDTLSVTLAERAFLLNGGVRSVKIRGLTFKEFGKRDDPARGTGSANVGTVIMASDAHDIQIIGNTIQNSAAYGIYSVQATNNITIRQNNLSNLAHTGIYVVPTVPGAGSNFSPNLIDDNFSISYNTIHDVAMRYNDDVGIEVDYTVGASVSHNDVYNTPTTGIRFVANDSYIWNNYVHETGLLIRDGGAIYGYGELLTRGNVISNNLIKNTGGYGKTNIGVADAPSKFKHGTFGIYFDTSSGGNTVLNNVVVNGTRGCLNSNGGSSNSFTNNICINSGTDLGVGTQFLATENKDSWTPAGGVIPTGSMIGNLKHAQKFFEEGVVSKTDYLSHYSTDNYFKNILDCTDECLAAKNSGDYLTKNTVTRNIFYYPGAPSSKAYIGVVLGTDQSINRNLIYSGTDITVSRSWPERSIITTTTWEGASGWKALGFDNDSLVADPQFADNTFANNNFSVLSTSPALTLGFKNIDMSTVGNTRRGVSDVE